MTKATTNAQAQLAAQAAAEPATKAKANAGLGQIIVQAPAPKTLAMKLLDVMKDVEYLQKTGTNTFQNYSYATEADVSEAFRKAFIKHKIFMIPSGSIEPSTIPTSAKGQSITNVKMQMLLINAEDPKDVFNVPWAAQGSDNGDKGIYKAMTGGVKSFLMKTFLLPTGDDPEVARKDEAPEPVPETEIHQDQWDLYNGKLRQIQDQNKVDKIQGIAADVKTAAEMKSLLSRMDATIETQDAPF